MPQIILPVFRLHGMLSVLYVFGRCNTVECAYVSIYTTTAIIQPLLFHTRYRYPAGDDEVAEGFEPIPL